MNRTYTDEEFVTAISKNITIAEALRALNLKVTGGNYVTAYTLIKHLNINTSHMLGNKLNLGKKKSELFISKSLKEILIKGSLYKSTRLKHRLFKEGILKNICSEPGCGLSEWNNKPITLHMDHINGDPADNRLCNLRILCPNCHSQTETYSGRNKTKRTTKKRTPKPKPKCLDCNKNIDRKATRCKPCAGKHIQPTKIQWPSTEDLIKMVAQSSYVAAGKNLGVSDNAIRQRIKRHPA